MTCPSDLFLEPGGCVRRGGGGGRRCLSRLRRAIAVRVAVVVRERHYVHGGRGMPGLLSVGTNPTQNKKNEERGSDHEIEEEETVNIL